MNRQRVEPGRLLYVPPDEALLVRWVPRCSGTTSLLQLQCRGFAQKAASVTIQPVYDSGLTTVLKADVSQPSDITVQFSKGAVNSMLEADTLYAITVTSSILLPHNRTRLFTTNVSVTVQTALRQKDWSSAEWIGGYTQLRARPAIPTGRIVQATAYASGVGCFRLTVNGLAADPVAFMEPGWSVLPTHRLLYRAYNISTLLAPSQVNAIDIRLGMCKYGYIDSFCSPDSQGSGARCRGLLMQLSIRYADGTTFNLSTTSTGGYWEGTTSENPIVYDHLFNGEIYDARLEKLDWDRADSINNSEGGSNRAYSVSACSTNRVL